jgi:hypothetical protein
MVVSSALRAGWIYISFSLSFFAILLPNMTNGHVDMLLGMHRHRMISAPSGRNLLLSGCVESRYRAEQNPVSGSWRW